VKKLQVISIQHQQFPLETIGLFHLDRSEWGKHLTEAKNLLQCDEIMFINTCNRVEWIFTNNVPTTAEQRRCLFQLVSPDLSDEDLLNIAEQCLAVSGMAAATHMLHTAASLNSAVIGEHEILGQIRDAYQFAHDLGMTSDGLRIILHHCILSSKRVFTETDLRRKPVSVVSIAWREFLQRGFNPNHSVLLVGAGQINTNFAKFLFENEFKRVKVCNRSLPNAFKLHDHFGFQVVPWEELHSSSSEADVMVVCTGSTEAFIDHLTIANWNTSPSMIIDLSMPSNVDLKFKQSLDCAYFGMEEVQKITEENINYREQALEQCLPILADGLKEYAHHVHERKIERAMQQIPVKIKEIRDTATEGVFQKQIMALDPNTQVLLSDILDYMEKKYISVPMKMAKQVLLETQASKHE
jgi:glutamyl-tRNA reductase